ncbi:MAG: hypothetical protein OXF20_01925 [Gammaproteobacteria bacterium]|nr:hypothetical protein [Gammaproteobacteria bacterium]
MPTVQDLLRPAAAACSVLDDLAAIAAQRPQLTEQWGCRQGTPAQAELADAGQPADAGRLHACNADLPGAQPFDPFRQAAAGQGAEFARLAAGTPATRFAGPDAGGDSHLVDVQPGGPGMDNVKVIAVMVPPLKVQGLTIRRLEGGWKRHMHRNAMQPACLSFTAQKSRRLCGVRTTRPGQFNCGDEASTSPPLKNATMFQPPGSCCQTRPTENRNSYCMAGGVIGMTNNDR